MAEKHGKVAFKVVKPKGESPGPPTLISESDAMITLKTIKEMIKAADRESEGLVELSETVLESIAGVPMTLHIIVKFGGKNE